ncbi:MAG: MBL fold metallo-hydrolase, partial [Actinomycetota bacterium]|nr:MBL fold metallo-hydrolase [Actinomycetota bacterium]
MQLTPDVYLVGSGASGIGISHPFDCHVYAVDGGSEVAMVDAGCGKDADAVMRELRAAGLVERLRYLLLTHAH